MFVSDGSLVTTKTPLNISGGSSYFPWMPPMATHGWPSAYAGIYSRQLWVYVVVSKLAKAAARLPLPVYQRNDLDRPRADNHPMAKLLSNPNPGMSGFDLWLWTSATFDIYGDTFWLKKRQRGQVVGLYPLHPSSVSNDEGRWNFDNGKLRLDDIPDTDLVSFKDFHPDSLTRGLSPLEPLRATLENEWSARTATSSFWQRGARPGTALVHPGNISEGAAERVKKQYDSIAAGSGNTGATVVLEEGMEPKTLTLTAEEAQYIETRKLNREEVCAAYDVPPPVVHILDRATFSNITEQMRSMYRDTMAPRLKAFEAAIEVGLRAVEWPDDNIYAEFLMDEVLRGDFETRQDALAKASHMTIAEKRKVENLPFIAGTDRIFLNTATMPLDAIDAQSAAIVAQTERADDALAEVIPLSVARSVMGRLSWQPSLAEVDPKALTDGLSEADRKAVEAALSDAQTSGGSVADLRERVRAMGRKQTKAGALKTPDMAAHRGPVRETLAEFFSKQGMAVTAAGRFNLDHWNVELAPLLHVAALRVSSAIGRASVRSLGYEEDAYDVARTKAFLLAVAARLADNINQTTAKQYEGADPDGRAEVFSKAASTRADGIAVGVTTLIGNFAVIESAKHVGSQGTKTWVTGDNPRPEHAAMDGQTVGIDEFFSDGSEWPGGLPGCNCSVEVSL